MLVVQTSHQIFHERVINGFGVTVRKAVPCCLHPAQKFSFAESTGVLPVLTTCFGPHTELVGLRGGIWPTTSQSKSIWSAARCCFTLAGASAPESCSMVRGDVVASVLRLLSVSWNRIGLVLKDISLGGTVHICIVERVRQLNQHQLGGFVYLRD